MGSSIIQIAMEKIKIKPWEVSGAFWQRAEKLLPKRKRDPKRSYKRKSGGGRKPLDPRKVFEAIVYVLRTGIQWKALPKEKFGSPSSVHTYFQEWEGDGFFLRLWKAGLNEYDEMEGIAWEWQSADGATNKSPMGKQDVGNNPTDRGKKRNQKKPTNRRTWRPALNRRVRSQYT